VLFNKENVGHSDVTHKGTSDMKHARKHTLIQECELFRI